MVHEVFCNQTDEQTDEKIKVIIPFWLQVIINESVKLWLSSKFPPVWSNTCTHRYGMHGGSTSARAALYALKDEELSISVQYSSNPLKKKFWAWCINDVKSARQINATFILTSSPLTSVSATPTSWWGLNPGRTVLPSRS